MLVDPAASLSSQKDIHDVTVEDILMHSESNRDHQNIWETYRKHYLLSSLELASKMPSNLGELSSEATQKWIASTDVAKHMAETKGSKLHNPYPFQIKKCTKAEVINLPILDENPASKTGMANIMNTFSNELKIPRQKKKFLPFNSTKKTFDIKAARERYLFLKTIEKNTSSNDADITFKNMYDTLSKTDSTFSRSATYIKDLKKEWNGLRNSLVQHLLHIATENNDVALVKNMISVGVDLNVTEGCGATPLILAVLKRNIRFIELFCCHGAAVDGYIYQHIPSPVELATRLEDHEVIDILSYYAQNEEERFGHK